MFSHDLIRGCWRYSKSVCLFVCLFFPDNWFAEHKHIVTKKSVSIHTQWVYDHTMEDIAILISNTFDHSPFDSLWKYHKETVRHYIYYRVSWSFSTFFHLLLFKEQSNLCQKITLNKIQFQFQMLNENKWKIF